MRVIVYGSANLDTSVWVEAFPRPGETIHAHRSSSAPGGKGLNQAVAAARMGAEAVIVASIGDDARGQAVRLALAAEPGLDLSRLRSEPHTPTGQALITVDADGENQIVLIAGANGSHSPAGVPGRLEFAEAGDVLVCQLEIPMAATAAALAYGRSRGLVTVLNAAPGAPVADLLGDVSLLVVNETEARIVLEDESAATTDLAARIHSRHGVDVVVTLGAAGVLWHTAEGPGERPAFEIDPIDTTGAGDAFVGGLATFLAEGHPLAEAIDFAAAVGAMATTGDGAQGYEADRDVVRTRFGLEQPTGPASETKAYWEGRYRERGAMWSGRVNAALVQETGALTPGTALDLGCGEGADAIWLAEQGWHVTGVDISATALGRAEAEARRRGVADRITWQRADLAHWRPAATYDLVSACFLHSQLEFPRDEILRGAAAAVAPGGAFLIVGHVDFPPWAARDHGHDHEAGENLHAFPSAAEAVTGLGLDGPDWEVLVAESRVRSATSPAGELAELTDAVVLARRR
ncbi:PfkB family carbohydrate kinase [Pseudactinotalea sp. HY158]|uniref:PfkB family carbohydrate kinase n=1 Tax=Pseudactinotalea sp. HY158 TaxID=2654547 RepID=UPI0018921A36|nr:PfkB family carbohydrate kinase [Pseudactinotalea sp. HY158]